MTSFCVSEQTPTLNFLTATSTFLLLTLSTPLWTSANSPSPINFPISKSAALNSVVKL